MEIGNWVKRPRPEAKWHLVESIISDDPVTRCGKRLRVDAPSLVVSDVEPLTRVGGQPQNCHFCKQEDA